MRKYLEKFRDDEGFTLIEMLIVVMIVSFLLLLVVTNIRGVEETVKKTTDEGIVQTVESQMVIYEMKKNKKPTLEELKTDGYITPEQLQAYNAAEKINK